jgi:DNA-binding response OmpR family regulator
MRALLVGAVSAEAETLANSLRKHGFHVDRAVSGKTALDMPRQHDLVLLDLELPDMDGVELCRAVRCESDAALISFTTSSEEVDRVLALQAGSDDCLVRPFGFRELLARIQATLRRVRPGVPHPGLIEHGPLVIDPAAREVSLAGRPVTLTRREFDLLHLLAAHPATVVSRKELLSRLWGYDCPTRSRTVDMHVSGLRRKLGAAWIVTVHGVGFRFSGQPSGTVRDSAVLGLMRVPPASAPAGPVQPGPAGSSRVQPGRRPLTASRRTA